MNNLRIGANNRAEIRSNIPTALKCYITLANVLARRQPAYDLKIRFFTTEILPILDGHVKYISSDVSFKHFAEQNAEVCALAVKTVDIEGIEPSIRVRMEALSDEIVENMKVSVSKKSDDFQISQKAVADEAIRWIRLRDCLASPSQLDESNSPIQQKVSMMPIISTAIEVLESHDGTLYQDSCTACLTILRQITWSRQALGESSVFFSRGSFQCRLSDCASMSFFAPSSIQG